MQARAGRILEETGIGAETPEGKDHEFRLNFSRNVAKAPKSRKMTNQALCDRIGMKHPKFSRIIRGGENVTMALIRRISEGLALPADRLFIQPRETAGTRK